MNTHCPSCYTVNRVPDDRLNDQAKCGKCGHALFAGQVVNATQKNFNSLIHDALPTIVDFWAPWCGPCRNFAPIFERVAAERARQIRCLKVNTENETTLATQFNIRSIPTIMVFKEGKIIATLNGALPKEAFLEWLDNALKSIKA